MISVDDALAHLFAQTRLLPIETVPLAQASGRILAADVTAKRDQPPFPASAMDGYAICASDFKTGTTLQVIGEAAAGARFNGTVQPGQAVRIFTGAPVPSGADWILIQEDTTPLGDTIKITGTDETKSYIRPAGTDFKTGDRLTAPRCLTPEHIALLASMNIAEVPVRKRADIALISTGTELVMPGEIPGPDQIIASNTFGLHAMLTRAGANVRVLPIAHDTLPALRTTFGLAKGADLTITIGGASVGDHDLVKDVTRELGMQRAFYKVAMRPGKPLMAGRLGAGAMVGLPGNPVSAMVCGVIFILPMLRAMQGLGEAPAPHQTATLASPLKVNGPRTHYMRATENSGTITAADRQDSALLTVLADANALLMRPPNDPAREIGDTVQYVPLLT